MKSWALVTKTVDEIDTCRQFHQPFMRTFFIQNFGAKELKVETFGFETFWQKDIVKKRGGKMLMKLTPAEHRCQCRARSH